MPVITFIFGDSLPIHLTNAWFDILIARETAIITVPIPNAYVKNTINPSKIPPADKP